MATKHQIATARRTGKIPTGQPLELNPRERLNQAEIYTNKRTTNGCRIKHLAPSAWGGEMETSTTFLIFNVDGEIYLKPDAHGYAPHHFGRHDPITTFGKRYGSDEEIRAAPDLVEKAEKLAKELQKVLDEAGRGTPPDEDEIKLRALMADAHRFPTYSDGKPRLHHVSLDYFERLKSPLGGLRKKAVKKAQELEELAGQIALEIKREEDEIRARRAQKEEEGAA